MKIKYLIYLLVILNIVIFGCAQRDTSMENMEMEKDKIDMNEDIEFKQMCEDASYEWMLMKPTQDGKIVLDEESCWGCMVKGIEHVCDKEKFDEMMKNDMESGMHSMQHMAMTAHGGTRSFVDIHMYKVGFIRPDVQPGKEGLLRFTINDIQFKNPISNIEIVHDKIMHVVLVRNDLKHFDHIHPKAIEPGVFAVPYTFSSSGIYRIWIDFTIDGMQHIVDFDINVLENTESQEKETLEGLNVKFMSPIKIITNQETELIFEIFDKNNKPLPIIEKFLAADAHLISIDEYLEEFNHNHDEKFDEDSKISFTHTFTKSGKHKIWVQFSAEGKAKTASFEVIVS